MLFRSKDNQTSGLIDMSQGMAVQVTGKPASGTSGKVRTKRGGKVSVVDPGDGPSGILIAKEENGIPGEGNSDGMDAEALAETEDGTEKILLDQENGGMVDGKKKALKIDGKILLVFCLAAAAVIGIVTVVVILKGNERERRKKRKRKKKKHSHSSEKKKRVK